MADEKQIEELDTAFLVPSTTRNRDWTCLEDTYLYRTLFGSMDHYCPDVPISVYVGYDEDDPIYSKQEERLKANAVFMKFDIIWVPFPPDPGNVVAVWNGLFKIAMGNGFNWFKILGDDIRMPNDRCWLRSFQNKIKKNNYIGWAAGFSGNTDIATQFLIHRTHWEIFEFVFPSQIKNYYCDDWLYNVYSENYRYWNRSMPLLNTGGQPRYVPNDHAQLCKMLVKRHRPEIGQYINLISK